MTNFDIYTASPAKLDELLYAVVDDALSAKGCALNLQFPPDDMDWESWMEMEYSGGLPLAPMFPEPPQNLTPEQHNAQVVTDKLQDILDIMQSNPTPFAQALRDVLNKAVSDIQGLLSS